MGIRRGQGFGAPKPKRNKCPDCGKHGLTQWRATANGMLLRGCQYCQRQESLTPKEFEAKYGKH